MSTQGGQFDTSIDIVTPENIAFQYRLAGPFQRAPAYIIDLTIRLIVTVVLGCFGMLSWTLFQLPSLAPFFIVSFVLEWFYGGFFEAVWNGQTPGKWLCRLRVLTIHGEPINGVQAVTRNVLRAADMMPLNFTFQLGILSCLMTDRYQRLGDVACGTMVVVEERRRMYGVARIEEPEAHRLAAELPPGLQVTRGQARAISQYAQRRKGFSWPRREEICRHLAEPLRERLNLPPNVPSDLLICAIYIKVFVDDRPELAPSAPQSMAPSTAAWPQRPQAAGY